MSATSRDTLIQTLSPDMLDLIDKAILEGMKSADKGQVIIEFKQHTVHSIFIGHNLIVPKINGNSSASCNS